MIKELKGASDGGDSANISKETEKKVIDEGVEEEKEKENTNTNVNDKEKAELEDLRRVRAGQDKKIQELLSQKEELKREKEEKELAGKSTKEQNAVYQKKIAELERKESFRKAFKESGLNADEWEFVNNDNHSEKANKIVEIFKREKEAYANKQVEAFKLSELEKVNKNIPIVSDDKIEKNDNHHLDMAKKLKNN